MSYTFVKREVEFTVTDEAPMRSLMEQGHGRQFQPAWVLITAYPDKRVDVVVKGPMLTAAGKPLKKWGVNWFDSDDLTESAPAWLVAAVTEVQGG